MRRPPAAALLVVLLVLLAACAHSPSAYTPTDVQQQGSCDGVPAPAAPSLLRPEAVVAEAVVCTVEQRYVQQNGSWDFTVARTVPVAKVAALVAALRLPDATGNAEACTAMLVTVPGFVLTVADGSRIRPGAPGGGCHPRSEVLDALGAADTVKSETRGAQRRTEWGMTTNCGDTAKGPAVWQTASIPGLSKLPTLPSSGSISVCRYHGSAEQEGRLVAAGLQPIGAVDGLWPTTEQVGPPRCDTPDDLTDSPPADWLMFLRAPTPPYRLDDAGDGVFAILELGGCGRLIDPVNGLAWSTDLDVGTELTGLADHPVG